MWRWVTSAMLAFSCLSCCSARFWCQLVSVTHNFNILGVSVGSGMWTEPVVNG